MVDKNNKDIANSINKYVEYTHKGTNLILDGAENINKWYEEQLNKITEDELDNSRLETYSKNITEIDKNDGKEIETKAKQYNKVQTNKGNNSKLVKSNKIQTILANSRNSKIVENAPNKTTLEKNKITTSKTSMTIRGAKFANNSIQKAIKTGKNINIGLNEDEITAFKETSSKIMTKPIKKMQNQATRKITKEAVKYTKKLGKKINRTIEKKIISKTTNSIVKVAKLAVKLIATTIKFILSMLPEIAPILIILVSIIVFCSFFGVGMNENTRKSYETYMINTQTEYDKTTVEFYNSGKVVDGTIEGRGMIDWKAPLSIMQMLNGELNFDNTEKGLLEKFKNANLFEQIEDSNYTYEKEVEIINEDGVVTKTKETITENKKVVTNPSLNSYIEWCNNNFNIINDYKEKKKIKYNSQQTKFTDNEIEQIKLLYNSNSFFNLFSEDFKSTYAYSNVNISDEQIRKIYDEFLKNRGKRYLMDHSNLKYDTCMDYYDCSSWVIHCLAHTGIKTIPNANAEEIYKYYCYPIAVEERKAGDLIFLKNTYGNFPTEGTKSITHIGIYMGELTINGETEEWIVDTGGNPEGVRIKKYRNNWWNGQNFYGFARLKQ